MRDRTTQINHLKCIPLTLEQVIEIPIVKHQSLNMSGDALDYLLDHPSEERDVFRDVDTNMDVPAGRKNTTAAQAIDSAFGLGIDEEVQISKRRKPVAKLDENR